MEESKIREVTLREIRTEKDVSILTASINDDGDLVLEGYDVGEAPKRFWGDDDYEFYRVIKKEHKDTILRQLSKEQYDTGSRFKLWLDKKGIPYGRRRAIKEEYRDTVLLLLIKERFDTDTDFKIWLDRNDIPSEFGSWV